jgi:hypothetical protein
MRVADGHLEEETRVEERLHHWTGAEVAEQDPLRGFAV